MSGAELDDVMVSFYRHEFDVLLCTTIIENGLDIQNVNTIIINRADRLGLSQIHQFVAGLVDVPYKLMHIFWCQ